MGNLNEIPQGWKLCDGSNGTPDLRGRFLQSFDLLNPIGTFLEAKLPNIKGGFHFNGSSAHSSYGAVTIIGNPGDQASANFSGWYENDFKFNASSSNSIYSDDCNTVQPPAYTVYYIIKIA